MLSDKIDYYKACRKSLHTTPAQYKDAYPYLREVDSLALANVQLNLQAAYKNFFENRKSGFPKFKSKRRSRKSYTTNNQKSTIAILDGGIRLPKTGVVRAVIHRKPESGWVVKSATVSQESDGKYYISVLFEYDAIPAQHDIDFNKAIGLDYASDGLYVDSDGNKGSEHKYFRESQRKLARAQRRLSRRQGFHKGEAKSKNFIKQQRRVNKIYRHAANQRLDTLHKLSSGIANRYDIVCIETLDMKAISNKGFHNGKATMDNGYGIFVRLLEYKLTDRGKYLVRVDKWFPSSQICHKCGTIHKEMKDLKIRVMDCACGNYIGRDQNAAMNIRDEGIRILKEELAA